MTYVIAEYIEDGCCQQPGCNGKHYVFTCPHCGAFNDYAEKIGTVKCMVCEQSVNLCRLVPPSEIWPGTEGMESWSCA